MCLSGFLWKIGISGHCPPALLGDHVPLERRGGRPFDAASARAHRRAHWPLWPDSLSPRLEPEGEGAGRGKEAPPPAVMPPPHSDTRGHNSRPQGKGGHKHTQLPGFTGKAERELEFSTLSLQQGSTECGS